MSDMMKADSSQRQSEENRILLYYLMRSRKHIRMYSMSCFRCWMTEGLRFTGQNRNFKNTILIMTSNIGANYLLEENPGR